MFTQLVGEVKVHRELGAVLVSKGNGFVRAQGIQRRLYLFFQNLNIIQTTGLTGALPERVRGSLGVGAVGVEHAAILDEHNVAVVVGLGSVVLRVSGCVRVVYSKLEGCHKAV